MKKYIYLIAYDYHSSFGKLVKMKSNSIYNHAGLSLTRDFHPTYTYVRNNNVVNDKRYRHGFSEEELSDILQKDDKAKMKVIEVEVDSYQYEKAEALIEGFIKDASKTTYDFFNLSTIALNIKRKYYNLPDYSFICSEFVAYIMNEIGRPISDKSINLTLPSDIANADKTMKNAKVIYNGLISEYMITTESYIMEMKRSELPDSEFGVPEERKYPLETKEHVYFAIKLFNHVNPKYEAELARNIKRKMKEYNITNISVGPNNRFGKYYKKGVKESMDIITEAKKYEVITDEKRLQKSIDEIMKSKDPNLVKMGKAMDVAIRNDFENPNALLGTINVVIILGLATPAILLTIISVLAIMASLIPLSLYAKLLTAHKNFLKSRLKPDEITKGYYNSLNELIKTGSIQTVVIEGYQGMGENTDTIIRTGDKDICYQDDSIIPYCESLKLKYENEGIEVYDESKLVWGNYVQMMENCFVVKPKYFSLSGKKYSFLSGDYLSSNIMTLRQYDIFPKLNTENLIDSYQEYAKNSINYILKHPNESPMNRRIYDTYNKCIRYYKMSQETTMNTIFDEYFFSNEMESIYNKYGEDGLNQLLNLKLDISLDIMNRLVSIHSKLVRQLSEDYIAAFTNPNVLPNERQKIVNEIMDALAKELKSNRSNSKNYNVIYMSKYDSRCGNIYIPNDTIEQVLQNKNTSNYDLDPIRQAIGFSFLYDAVFIGHGVGLYHTDGKVYEEDFGIHPVDIDGTICRSATEAIDKLLELGNKKILLITCNMSPKSSEYIERRYCDNDATIVIAGSELLMEQYTPDDQSNIICVNVDYYSNPENIVNIHCPHSKIFNIQESTLPQEVDYIKTGMLKCINDTESIYNIFNEIYNNYLPVYLDINASFHYTNLYTGKRKDVDIVSYHQIQKIYGMIFNQISSIIIDIGKRCNTCINSYTQFLLKNDMGGYKQKSAFTQESLTNDQLHAYYLSSWNPVTEAPNEEDTNEEDPEDTENNDDVQDEGEIETPKDEEKPEEDETIEPTTDAETDDKPIEDEAEDTSTDYTDDVTDPDDTGEPDQADDYTTDVDNPDEEDQAEGDDLTATDFTGAVTANVDDEEIETGEPATDETEDQPAAEEPEGDIPEGETGAEDEAGMEEPADFTDGVDGAEGDTGEGEDTGEEPPADETADETGEEPVENEQDNNNLQNSIVKNYNLMIDFQKIYQSIEDILKHLKSVNYTTSIQNSVLDRCINNLTNLKNEVLTYIEYDYSNDYKTNLYYYTTYVQALKIVLEMLRSIQMLNKESNNNLKSKNSKGV